MRKLMQFFLAYRWTRAASSKLVILISKCIVKVHSHYKHLIVSSNSHLRSCSTGEWIYISRSQTMWVMKQMAVVLKPQHPYSWFIINGGVCTVCLGTTVVRFGISVGGGTVKQQLFKFQHKSNTLWSRFSLEVPRFRRKLQPSWNESISS